MHCGHHKLPLLSPHQLHFQLLLVYANSSSTSSFRNLARPLAQGAPTSLFCNPLRHEHTVSVRLLAAVRPPELGRTLVLLKGALVRPVFAGAAVSALFLVGACGCGVRARSAVLADSLRDDRHHLWVDVARPVISLARALVRVVRAGSAVRAVFWIASHSLNLLGMIYTWYISRELFSSSFLVMPFFGFLAKVVL